MRRFNIHEHYAMVDAFFAECEERDPEKYAEVCEKYPTISANQHRAIRRRERQVGLLGLQASHIPTDLARRHGFESVYEDESDN